MRPASNAVSPVAGCESAAPACANSPDFGDTAGSWPYSPAGGRSAISPTHLVPTASPPSNEGYLFTGDGGLIAARVVKAPWLTRLKPLGEDVSLVLETADGVVQIAGQTVFCTHDIHHDDDMFSMQALKQEMPSFPALQQAGVRYRWDGEET